MQPRPDYPQEPNRDYSPGMLSGQVQALQTEIGNLRKDLADDRTQRDQEIKDIWEYLRQRNGNGAHWRMWVTVIGGSNATTVSLTLGVLKAMGVL